MTRQAQRDSRAYDQRVRRRLIGAGALVLAGAVVVTAWLVTRSDRPAEFGTPEAAVLAVCHADANQPPHFLGDSLAAMMYAEFSKRGLPVKWSEPGKHREWVAPVEKTGSGKYQVLECRTGIQVKTDYQEVGPP